MAKRYNVRHKLTWHNARKCWKKFHRGRTYYLARGKCRGKTDKSGYDSALREWITILPTLEIPAAAFTEPLYADPVLLAGKAVAFATNYRAVAKILAPSSATSKTAEMPTNIAGLVDAFLADCRVMSEAGQFTKAQYSDMRHRLADFKAFCEHAEATDIAHLSNNLLAEYRQSQLALTTLDKSQGGISPVSARKRLQFLARFVTWLAEREVIDAVPKIVNRKFAAVKLPAPKPKFFDVSQIQQVLADSPSIVRACILLALNCGFTQVDINTLEHAHINLKTGILSRPRNKTGVDSAFPLWPETLEAIQKIGTNPKQSSLVILSESGLPLLRETIKPDGRVVRVDTIGNSFRTVLVRRKLGDSGLAFKHLRKTSADLIAQKFPPHCVDQFLAHVTSSMRKHYAKDHLTDEFRSAVEYLRTAYYYNAN